MDLTYLYTDRKYICNLELLQNKGRVFARVKLVSLSLVIAALSGSFSYVF